MESYAQDLEPIGGLYIYIEPARSETVNAIADFLITDPAGRQTGLDISQGIIVQGIPNASYAVEGNYSLNPDELGVETVVLEAYTPTNGLYKLAVIGTASGSYHLDIDSRDINFSRSSQKLDGTTYPGKIDNYEITYSSVAGSQVSVKFTGSSSVPVFDGKGQSPDDVNKFLQYFNPTQARTNLPSGTQSFNLMIIYGNTIKRETFSATLNGTDITSKFDPLPGKMEIVKIPLIQGTNTLVLSIKGVRSDGRTAKDTDRLVFLVP